MPRTIIITGSSDGIGAAAARQLREVGEHVVVVGRNPDKTARVAEALEVDSFVADFAELDQVRSLAASLLDRYERIDVLANNAGGIFGDRAETRDGLELTFQVNHLAPFLLTTLLMDRLVDSNAAVIQTSSSAARALARFDIDDLQGQNRYSASVAYGNAKLANLLFTKELHRRYGEAGINAVALHPGVIGSNFASGSSGMLRWFYSSPLTSRLLTSVDIGGARLTWLAAGNPGIDWHPGGFYAANKAIKTPPNADDPALAKLLWDRSAALAG